MIRFCQAKILLHPYFTGKTHDYFWMRAHSIFMLECWQWETWHSTARQMLYFQQIGRTFHAIDFVFLMFHDMKMVICNRIRRNEGLSLYRKSRKSWVSPFSKINSYRHGKNLLCNTKVSSIKLWDLERLDIHLVNTLMKRFLPFANMNHENISSVKNLIWPRAL